MLGHMTEGSIPAGQGTRARSAEQTRRRALVFTGLLIIVGALLMLGSGVAGAQEESLDNEYCLSCHGAPGLTSELPSGEVLDLTVLPEVFGSSVHGAGGMECVACHTEITGFPHDPIEETSLREYVHVKNDSCSECHSEQAMSNLDDVHGAAVAAGNLEAAVCTDCHGAHDTMVLEPRSPEIPQTCRTCHSEIYDLYAESVHGQALIDGNQDVPTCTDCHGVHEIEGPSSDHPFRLFSPQICATCHADGELMGKYDISTAVFETYVADFHGSTVVLFEELAPDQETNKPVCIDCHGVHAIRPADDQKSTVAAANILQTCQRCHPNAEANFPTSWLGHYVPEPGQATLVWLVNLFYRIVIPLVVGGMALLAVIDVYRRFQARRRERTADGNA